MKQFTIKMPSAAVLKVSLCFMLKNVFSLVHDYLIFLFLPYLYSSYLFIFASFFLVILSLSLCFYSLSHMYICSCSLIFLTIFFFTLCAKKAEAISFFAGLDFETIVVIKAEKTMRLKRRHSLNAPSKSHSKIK